LLSPLNTSPVRPPVNRVLPRGSDPRMTRGQCGSLLLHCNGLSPSTSCRSSRRTAAQWLACTFPYRRFADILADACARLGADVVRYSFIVVDLHHLLLAGLPAHLCENSEVKPSRRMFVSNTLNKKKNCSGMRCRKMKRENTILFTNYAPTRIYGGGSPARESIEWSCSFMLVSDRGPLTGSLQPRPARS